MTVGIVIRFPKLPRSLARGQDEPQPRQRYRTHFREVTRCRLRGIIVPALAILDSLEETPPDDSGGSKIGRRCA